jgi:hypothetical protein
MTKEEWKKVNADEQFWWGTCANTYAEETKQLLYASKMGLTTIEYEGSNYWINTPGKKILDIGGGPISILLKCHQLQRGKVIDPCPFHPWVAARYQTAKIDHECILAEEMNESGWDEVWIYNVLEHTMDPQLIAQKALQAGTIVRVFEWIGLPSRPGHPHSLSEPQLNIWFNGKGTVEILTGQNHCHGSAYYGVFGRSEEQTICDKPKTWRFP